MRRWPSSPRRSKQIPARGDDGKLLFHSLYDRDLEKAYSVAAETMVSSMSSEDVGEGIDAFIAKRQPVWRGR